MFGHVNEMLTKHYQKNWVPEPIVVTQVVAKNGQKWEKVVFLGTTCVITINAGILISFDIGLSVSDLYLQEKIKVLLWV